MFDDTGCTWWLNLVLRHRPDAPTRRPQPLSDHCPWRMYACWRRCRGLGCRTRRRRCGTSGVLEPRGVLGGGVQRRVSGGAAPPAQLHHPWHDVQSGDVTESLTWATRAMCWLGFAAVGALPTTPLLLPPHPTPPPLHSRVSGCILQRGRLLWACPTLGLLTGLSWTRHCQVAASRPLSMVPTAPVTREPWIWCPVTCAL